jgi:hypothetical protein
MKYRMPRRKKTRMLDWQTIETAPKDDVIILTNGGMLCQGFWQDGWMTGFDDGVIHVRISLKPTHWAPLPDGPNAKKEEAKTDQQTTTACEWSLDEPDSDTWETDCGHMFTLNEGTPSQNRMRFCCYCGQQIKETLDKPPSQD